ncbi:MAG: hypothetical protein KatS3mg096_862 [Candidatus Parcubacteria bacterium]|nr:MAG: hypothetical protein KatS3mg096_862 [Candidatus Parcubacteria bacterium]
MKMRFIFLLIILITSARFVNSQENNLDKYIPQSNKAKEFLSSETVSLSFFKPPKNYIYADLLFLRGIACINYDFLINKRFIAGFGIGYNFYRDIILEGYAAMYYSGIKPQEIGIGYSEILSLEPKYTKGSIYINPNVKLIVGDYSSDEFNYVSLDIRRWGYTSEFNVENDEIIRYVFNPDNTINFRYTSLAIKYGRRKIKGNSEINFMTDLFFGVGLKFIKYDDFYFYYYDETNNFNQNIRVYEYTKLSQVSFIKPIVLFGYSIGLSF